MGKCLGKGPGNPDRMRCLSVTSNSNSLETIGASKGPEWDLQLLIDKVYLQDPFWYEKYV